MRNFMRIVVLEAIFFLVAVSDMAGGEMKNNDWHLFALCLFL